MTKQDMIDLLDKLEPEINHSNLKGKSLIEAKKKHHIGPRKNKQQLINAIEKATKEEASQKVKREALKALRKSDQRNSCFSFSLLFLRSSGVPSKATLPSLIE